MVAVEAPSPQGEALLKAGNSKAMLSKPIQPFQHVQCRDGVSLRYSLLLGGPHGDYRLDPSKRTVICLHGMDESLEYWSKKCFEVEPERRMKLLESNEAMAPPGGPKATKETERKRAVLVKELAKHVNVVMLDQRGFGESGRPTTAGPFQDSTVSAVATYEVKDASTVTTALSHLCNCTRRFPTQALSYTISLSGAKLVVRMSFTRLTTFIEHLLQELVQSSRRDSLPKLAKLKQIKVMAAPETLSMLSEDVRARPEVAIMMKHQASFLVDRLAKSGSSSEVTVIHSIQLDGSWSALEDVVSAMINHVQEGTECMGCYVAYEDIGGQGELFSCDMTAVLRSPEAAAKHIKEIHPWYQAAASGASTPNIEVGQVQVHARRAELVQVKELLKDSIEVLTFQVFPLSFESSLATTAEATLDDYAADVNDVMKQLDVEKATVVGHSMGASIALHHAVTYPNKVDRLVTIGGASRTGKAAAEMWRRRSGTVNGWYENIMRKVVANANIDEKALGRLKCPSLLLNAEDDDLTPLLGSQLLKRLMVCAGLEAPTWGGHNVVVTNDSAFERMVRFLLAEEYMLFAIDVLFAKRLQSVWNLTSDKALTAYYKIGQKLAEVEASERRVRRTAAWVNMAEAAEKDFLTSGWHQEDFASEMQRRNAEVERVHDKYVEVLQHEGAISSTIVQEVVDLLREQDLIGCLDDAVLEEHMEGNLAPKGVLERAMHGLVQAMTDPAQDLVEEAGCWWKDSGAQSNGYSQGKYTVDMLGRRRGASSKNNCAWFRWDKYCMPPGMLDQVSAEDGHALIASGENSSFFMCWWCGAHAGDHELLGQAGPSEEPGSTGPGGPRKPAPKPAALKAPPKPGVEASAIVEDATDPWPEEFPGQHQIGGWRRKTRNKGPPYQRIDLSAVQEHSLTSKAPLLQHQVPRWMFQGSSFGNTTASKSHRW